MQRLLLLPTALLYVTLMVVPLAVLLLESFRPYVGGRIGGGTGWTLQNYADYLHPQYMRSFRETFGLSLIATLIGLFLAYPIAHLVARTRSRLARRAWINLLVAALFLDILIRAYAVALLLGSTGLSPMLSAHLGILPNDVDFVRVQVVVGLVYLVIPISVLTLVGPIENVNPKLFEAAMTLGASRLKSVLATDVRLSAPAILSSFLVSFSLCISAFTMPLILGRGMVVFIANLIYDRFSDIANFPSGAALAVVLVLLSLLIVYAISLGARRLTRTA